MTDPAPDACVVVVCEALASGDDPLLDEVVAGRSAGVRSVERVTGIDGLRDRLTREPGVDVVLVDAREGRTDAVSDAVDVAGSVPVVALVDDGADAVTLRAAGAADVVASTGVGVAPLVLRIVAGVAERANLRRAVSDARTQAHAFTHRISHDLKSPLSVLLGSLDLLHRGEHDPDEDELYAMAARSTKRLVEMIDRIVEFADSSTLELVRQTVELDDVVDRVLDLLGDRLDGVDLHVQRPLPSVVGDPRAMRHVVRNLIDNALRHSSSDRPLRIDVEAEEHDGTVVLSVADNGRGIPPSERAAVWEPGHRIDRSVPGTGLGLSSTLAFVTAMEGTVEILDGRGGVGTTVRVVLAAGSEKRGESAGAR